MDSQLISILYEKLFQIFILNIIFFSLFEWKNVLFYNFVSSKITNFTIFAVGTSKQSIKNNVMIVTNVHLRITLRKNTLVRWKMKIKAVTAF